MIRYDAAMAEDVWLDDEERSTWIVLSGLLTTLPAALDAQLQRDSALTYFEYMVMVGLSGAPERTLRMSELARMASG